jgi:thioredoxin
MAVIDLIDDNFETEVLSAPKPVLTHFWAEWCGPCRMVAPIIQELGNELKNAMITRVNVDENPVTANGYGIRSIPTILLLYKGKVVDKHVGVSTKKGLENKIDKLIEKYEKEFKKDTELVGLTLINDELKLVSFTKDNDFKFLSENEQKCSLLYSFYFESVAIKEAISELEHLINNVKTKESDLQDFFNRYPDFIINDDYKSAHPHIILERDEGNLIPDYVLEPINNKLSDILDIKLPKTKVYTLKKNRPRYSSAVMEACAQLREYGSFFDEKVNRDRIFEKYGLTIYKPRMIVVIGRRSAVDPLVIRRIEKDTPELYLKNYDDIIERMKNKIR